MIWNTKGYEVFSSVPMDSGSLGVLYEMATGFSVIKRGGYRISVNSRIQDHAAKIVEDFFLSRTDEDLYAFLQEVVGRPLVERLLGKAERNPLEAATTSGSLYAEVQG